MCIIVGESGGEMFFGHKELTIDDKLRLVLPANYRDGFVGGKAYAFLGFDHCIALYPEETYQKMMEKVLALPDFDPKARNVKRNYLYNTFDLPIDSHNRILLPKSLVDHTKMGKKVVVAGSGDHLEIWDEEAFAKNMDDIGSTFSEDAQSLLSH